MTIPPIRPDRHVAPATRPSTADCFRYLEVLIADDFVDMSERLRLTVAAEVAGYDVACWQRVEHLSRPDAVRALLAGLDAVVRAVFGGPLFADGVAALLDLGREPSLEEALDALEGAGLDGRRMLDGRNPTPTVAEQVLAQLAALSFATEACCSPVVVIIAELVLDISRLAPSGPERERVFAAFIKGVRT